MADTTTFVTQLAFGLGLFYGVQKFFGVVEDKLNEDTKKDIALWMLDVERPSRSQGLASTFITMFDRVFGPKCFSIHFFARSAIATIGALAVAYLTEVGVRQLLWSDTESLGLLGLAFIGNIGFDYGSLVLSRKLFGTLQNRRSVLWIVTVVVLAGVSSVCMACCTTWLIMTILAPAPGGDYDFVTGMEISGMAAVLAPSIFASLIATMWLWLYVASGWLVRTILRLPIGIPLLNRWFDVEKKPLQCLGMMAGGIVAVCYWGWALVRILI